MAQIFIPKQLLSKNPAGHATL